MTGQDAITRAISSGEPFTVVSGSDGLAASLSVAGQTALVLARLEANADAAQIVCDALNLGQERRRAGLDGCRCSSCHMLTSGQG